ncbi:MAG: DNA repair protein RecN [Bacteroidetes bacterium]|nr:DNA repair protein RecN [Bacteroidota bacterium]
MLARLTIKNYILIHELDIDFPPGFSVITGETGSGKSILLCAMGLILGQRTDAGVLLDKSGKCIVEGVFNIKDYNLEQLFLMNELDYDNVLIVRREINQSGKSRAFINDTPVTLSLLKEFGDRLVNIHSQNAVITLNNANFQLAVLDNYSDLQKDVGLYRVKYNRFSELVRQLSTLKNQESIAAGERDYNKFLLDELYSANFVAGELTELEDKLNILRHAEEIKSNLYLASSLIAGADSNILSLLSEALRAINCVEKFNAKFKLFGQRLQVNYIDIKDLAAEIAIYEEQVDINPEETSRLTQRLDLLYRLLKKHQKQNIDELIVIRQSIEFKINNINDLNDQINFLNAEVSQLGAELRHQAASISEHRKASSPKFEKEIIGILSRLGIPNAQFKIELLASDDLTRDGVDKIRFFFSANKGFELRELSQTASGGELSRLMLSVKSMISQRNLLPTIIFDEIDNGVSGDIAGKVGTILLAMGSNMQVIAITHLPQIAGKGSHHFWVHKSEEDKISKTFIKKLTITERIEEIAKMLSNEIVTEAARSAANELLNN